MIHDIKDNVKDFPGYYISREGFLYSRYDNKGRLTNKYQTMYYGRQIQN